MSQNDLIEAAWLRRLLTWCRPRLSKDVYRGALDNYLERGPTPGPSDAEPRLVQSTPPAPAGLEEILLCANPRGAGDLRPGCNTLKEGLHSKSCPITKIAAVQALIDRREAELRAEIERRDRVLLHILNEVSALEDFDAETLREEITATIQGAKVFHDYEWAMAEIERLREALLLTYSIRACDLPDDSDPWINCAQTIDAARAALEEK